MSLNALGDKFGICTTTAGKILDEFGCKRYTKNQIFNPYLKEDYFDDIDCERKAYF